jgi:hypothetical protein
MKRRLGRDNSQPVPLTEEIRTRSVFAWLPCRISSDGWLWRVWLESYNLIQVQDGGGWSKPFPGLIAVHQSTIWSFPIRWWNESRAARRQARQSSTPA